MGLSRITPVALLALAGCSKGTEDWLAELRSDEPLQRMLGSAALREVEAADCERVVRELIQLRYDSNEVFAQAEASLRILAVRHPEVFVRLVDDPELRKDRWVVLEPLVDAGDAAVPELTAALRRGDPVARRGAALALGRLRRVEVLEAWAGEAGGLAVAVAYEGCEPAKDAGEPVRARLLAGVLDDLETSGGEVEVVLSAMGPSVLGALIEHGAGVATVVAVARPMGEAGLQALVAMRDEGAADEASVARDALAQLGA